MLSAAYTSWDSAILSRKSPLRTQYRGSNARATLAFVKNAEVSFEMGVIDFRYLIF